MPSAFKAWRGGIDHNGRRRRLTRDGSIKFPVSPQSTRAVKDASLTQTYSFLPASWAGDTHEETDFLPIGDQEEKERRCEYFMAKYLWMKVSRQGD